MKPIENRYEFLLIFDCENGNPNGDPDADNLPRTDSQDGHGLISDVSIKRKLRDYVALRGKEIFVKHKTNLNRAIQEAREQAGQPKAKATKATVEDASKIMCERFFDVRTFGAVMTTGANAGQVLGPVQITLARSIDPIHTMDWSITRVAKTEDLKSGKTTADYEKWEEEHAATDLQTMGRKSFIPYGLYVVKGFISAFEAEKTGFSQEDFELLCEAMLNMFEHSRSASRGLITTRRLIIFKHVGSAENLEDRKRQAKLGRVPAQRLLEQGNVVSITRSNQDRVPRAYADYTVTVDETKLPNSIEMLDLDLWDEEVFRADWTVKRQPEVSAKLPRVSRK